jgi:hypothetical protein
VTARDHNQARVDARPEDAAAAGLGERPLMYRLSKAAALTGLSEDFLRRVPDLPKVVIRGAGAKDRRPVVGILYEDLMAWLQRQRQG